MNDPDLIAAVLGTASRAPSNPAPGAAASSEYDADGRRRRIAAIESPLTQRRQSPRRETRRIGREQACVDQIGRLPEPGEELVMILDGSWHGFDLVGAVLSLAGVPAARLLVATLGFNLTQANRLGEMIDEGLIGSVVFVVSEMFRDQNVAEFTALAEVVGARGGTVAAYRNHMKLIVIELEDGRKFVSHGSLNLRRCNNLEQMALNQDAELAGFFESIIIEMAGGAS